MPAGNGTGPMGMGPMTGRGLGYCSGGEAPGFGAVAARRGYGTGLGRGRRGGRGGRWGGPGFYGRGWQPGGMAWGGYPDAVQGAAPELERQSLESRANLMEAELQRIRQRLADLGGGDSET